MKTIATILASIFLCSGCSLFKKDTSTAGAPRAIPVKEVVNSLNNRIDHSTSLADDIVIQAKDIDDKGAERKTPTTKKLVDSAVNLKQELVKAKTEIVIIDERSSAIERERDVYYKANEKSEKKNKDLEISLAKIHASRWFWIKFSIVTSSIILIWLAFKLLQSRLVQGYINPASILRP